MDWARKRIYTDTILGHLMFAVLFVLAALFYIERTIFVDPAYAVFNLTYFRDFVEAAGRTASVFPQSLALVAIVNEWPLRTVLFIYSVSFILLYYLVYLVIAHVFRLGTLALAVPLVLVLGIKYSFFWISTETHQALVYTILFYAFLTWSLNFPKGILSAAIRIVIASGMLWLCFFSHPVALFTVLFVLGYCMLVNRRWNRPEGYLLASVIVAMAVYKFLTSRSGGYEGFFFNGFSEFFDRLGYVFHSESFKFLGKNLSGIYLFPLLIFLITVAWYIRRREYLKIAGYAGYFILFALVLFTTFNIWFLPFIQEKNLMALNLVVLIPFLKEVEFRFRRGNLVRSLFLALAFLAGTVHIVVASHAYKDHLAYVGELIQTVRNFPEKKFVISDTLVDRSRLSVFWGLGPESLLLSSLDGPDSTVVIYVNDAAGRLDSTDDLNDTRHFFIVPWIRNHEVRKLHPRYFDLSGSRTRSLTNRDLSRGDEYVLYENNFETPPARTVKDQYRKGPDGNTWLETSSEFSPGVSGTYSGLIRHPSVFIAATVRVCPLELMTPGRLMLSISRERDGKVLKYYAGLIPDDSLKVGRWFTINASGPILSGDPADLLKIYVWNPAKKRVAIDDFRVTYRKMK